MPVDPRLAPLLATPLAAAQGTPAERRELAHAAATAMAPMVSRPAPDVDEVRDEQVPVAGGEIGVRVYRPSPAADLPALVYLHGGGWWMGNLEFPDAFCRRIANLAGHVVVSVDYRLAPEHPYPTPLEDAYAAAVWVSDHAASLGVDPARISIGGESAGANLAAAVTLLARERGRPRLRSQVLVVPAVDLTGGYPSRAELGSGYGLTADDIAECTAFYIGDADAADPHISPMFGAAEGLPPALILTAEFDPLRDEGEAYAAHLEQGGVPAKVRRFAGMLHGSVNLDGIVPEVTDEHDREIAAFLTA